MRNIALYIIMLTIALLEGCSSDKPDNLEPKLTTLPATDITRNSATLHGYISIPDNSTKPDLYFEYGTSEDFLYGHISTTATANEISSHIANLTAGTTYYYFVSGQIPGSSIRGKMLTFNTLPNDKPTLASPTILSYGPTSIILGYNLISDGGEELQQAGCYYADNNGERKQISITDLPSSYNKQKQIAIKGLKQNTTYRIWEYGINKCGETLSDTIIHTTGNALMLGEAGTLRDLIDNEKLPSSSITISGSLNGSDIEYLRLLASKDPDKWNLPSILTDINMTDAMIVEGGFQYGPYLHYTKTGVIGSGMFGECVHLYNIVLPISATTIEDEAFVGCTNLRHIEIPASVSSVRPSSSCTALAEISISAANTSYSSQDGVLLNADKSQIVWFPQGKKGEYSLPPTVSQIGDYAFRGCNIQKFTLPDYLIAIGQGAFMDSHVEEVIMPAKLKSLPTGTFQNCSALKTIRLGEQLELISDYVFDNCPLTDIYIDAPTPPVCNSKAFATHGTNFLQSCTLHVPKGSKPLYRNNRNWGQFQHIVE